ncbi:hypothetical protein ACS0TY_021444 [Phlomoides rotata]
MEQNNIDKKTTKKNIKLVTRPEDTSGLIGYLTFGSNGSKDEEEILASTLKPSMLTYWNSSALPSSSTSTTIEGTKTLVPYFSLLPAAVPVNSLSLLKVKTQVVVFKFLINNRL